MRANLRAAKLRGKKALLSLHTKTISAVSKLISGTPVTGTYRSSYSLKHSANAKLALYRERVLRTVRYNTHRNAGRVSSTAAGVAVGRTSLRSTKASSQAKKQNAL